MILGEHDVRDFLAISDTLAARIQKARRIVIERTAHLPSMESPEKIDHHLASFLRSAGA